MTHMTCSTMIHNSHNWKPKIFIKQELNNHDIFKQWNVI